MEQINSLTDQLYDISTRIDDQQYKDLIETVGTLRQKLSTSQYYRVTYLRGELELQSDTRTPLICLRPSTEIIKLDESVYNGVCQNIRIRGFSYMESDKCHTVIMAQEDENEEDYHLPAILLSSTMCIVKITKISD